MPGADVCELFQHLSLTQDPGAVRCETLSCLAREHALQDGDVLN